MLDWIFVGIVTWISSVMTSLMDAVSGLFLDALGTDMVVMEEYFPFVTKAFGILQYTAWALLFLITAWQLFRAFGGPITDAENPLTLVARSILFGVMIGYAQAIFQMTLDIARAPYTALMEVTMTAEDFTFAGIEEALKNGLVTIVATTSIVGTLLLVIREISTFKNGTDATTAGGKADTATIFADAIQANNSIPCRHVLKGDKTNGGLRSGVHQILMGYYASGYGTITIRTDYDIRNAISIGGDSDTIAAITGGMAEAYYGVPEEIRQQAFEFLDADLSGILLEFEKSLGDED